MTQALTIVADWSVLIAADLPLFAFGTSVAGL